MLHVPQGIYFADWLAIERHFSELRSFGCHNAIPSCGHLMRILWYHGSPSLGNNVLYVLLHRTTKRFNNLLAIGSSDNMCSNRQITVRYDYVELELNTFVESQRM